MKSREGILKLKRFHVDEQRRKVSQVEVMMQEFQTMMTDLKNQIQYEEERSGISDMTHFAYPTFARSARQRRENLQNSISELETKLAEANENLATSVEELKKIELLTEHENIKIEKANFEEEQRQLDEIAMHRFKR